MFKEKEMNNEKAYYAVIFTSRQTDDLEGYAETSRKMLERVRAQPGFLGVESARDGLGITVSYWESLEAIEAWKKDAEHRTARQRGREQWYASFSVRICRVEREYHFKKAE